MNLSFSEYRALVAKAFRGAGYSWGLTEEASFAAVRLAEFGLPAGEMVVRLLQQVDSIPTADLMPTSDWQSTGDALCPVCVGAFLADEGGCADLTLGPTCEPVFIAPLLMQTLEVEAADSAGTGPGAVLGYLISWDGGEVQVTSSALALTGELQPIPASVTITRQQLDLPDVAAYLRADLDDDVLVTLERFAHRVYAPATEASRNAGAGGADD